MEFPADHSQTADFGGLAASSEPAWLWQPGTGALLWGNAAALELWNAGSLADLQALRVDRAMPALAQLQRLQWALGADISHREGIVVWLPGGVRRLSCLCRKIPFAGQDSAILVTVTDPPPLKAPQAAAATAQRHLNGHADGRSAMTPRVQPDLAPEDAATLAEIARMIRDRSSADATAAEPGAAGTERLNEPLDSAFLARLSHELRTPLNAIMGYAELLQAERDGPLGSAKYRDFAGHILESAAHCLNLANDLADPSGLATGVRSQEFSEVDVAETVRVCLGILAPIATKAGVSMVEAVEDGNPRAIIDRRSLRQILLNVIANAIKATASGGTITAATAYRAGRGLEIVITDTGRGMTAEQLARARGEGGAHGGGLGLPLSRKLAEANGGAIAIESAWGEGTRVTFTMPMGRLVT